MGKRPFSQQPVPLYRFKEFQAELARAGAEMRLARLKTNVMTAIQRSPLYAAIPPEHYYPAVQDAVDAYLAEQGAQE
jgi:hypothetical protein